MVFMGSEQFPQENAYSTFISENGGSMNAYTARRISIAPPRCRRRPPASLNLPASLRSLFPLFSQDGEATVFHFEIQPTALRGALERFASQFVAPLCLESATDREVQAVDSEANQRLQSDSIRQMQVLCHSSAEGHPYRLFGCGNKTSLIDREGKPLRDLLLEHYSKHYFADRMTLALLGSEPLDALEAWARELFGPVRGGGGPRPSIAAAGFPYATGAAPVLYRIPAVREVHCVTVNFQLPPMDELYASKPYSYVSHLIGHESSGSLLSALKAKGLASGLWAGVTWGGVYRSSAVWLFGVCVTLSDAGFPRWTVRFFAKEVAKCTVMHRSAVIMVIVAIPQEAVDLLFSYIKMVKDAGPQQWVHDEIAAIRARVRSADAVPLCAPISTVLAAARQCCEVSDFDVCRGLAGYGVPVRTGRRGLGLLHAACGGGAPIPTRERCVLACAPSLEWATSEKHR